MSTRAAMRFVEAEQDPWQPPSGAAATPFAHALLSLDQWSALRNDWPAAMPVGVVVANVVDVEILAADLPRWSLVALQFPKWTDGRAYSQARLLVDMLPLLQRSGFDAVLMRPDQSLDAARRALRFFAGHYQGDVVQSRPLFARIEA
jgi:uncharacterized protein (DUF934 family)